jgi:hypothetical protein
MRASEMEPFIASVWDIITDLFGAVGAFVGGFTAGGAAGAAGAGDGGTGGGASSDPEPVPPAGNEGDPAYRYEH